MITPHETGFTLGSAAIGSIAGATQALGQALDFGNLLHRSPEVVESSDSAESESFAGLNDEHRQLAQHRTQLTDALSQLEEILGQLNLDGQSLTLSQDPTGAWRVSGPSNVRGQLESILNQSAEWQSAWDEALGQLQQLRGLSQSPAELPQRVQSLGDAWNSSEELQSDDLQLVHDVDGLTVELL